MKNLIAPLTIAALAVGSFFAADSLCAQSSTTKTEPAATQQEANSKPDATRVAKDGYAVVRAMHAARVAIFNGEPDMAKKALTDAKALIEKTKADEMVAGMKGDLIPIDGSLALTDTFVASPECTRCIDKANELFTAGDKAQALQELRLGKIDVDFSRILMPIAATEEQLTKAINFANDGKYYECNLALKAAEDGLQLDSVSLTELPTK